MVTKERVAGELQSERERLTEYLKALPDGAWDKESLCTGWTVKDLMSHVVGIASDVANRRLEDVGSIEQNQRQVDERRERSSAELLEEWTKEGKLLEDGVLELDDEFWNAPYSENFTVGQALQRMIEDIWTHSQDIRIPLGDDPQEGPGLYSTLEVGEREWEVRLPRLAPEVGSLTVEAGKFKATVAAAGQTDVKISGDPIKLALVSTGRIPLERAVKDGDLSVEPSAPAGLGDALNIYGP